MRIKQCKSCRVFMPAPQLDDKGICKACRNRRVVPAPEPEPKPVEEPQKACKSCGSMLEYSQFSDDKRTKDGKRKICKNCE